MTEYIHNPTHSHISDTYTVYDSVYVIDVATHIYTHIHIIAGYIFKEL